MPPRLLPRPLPILTPSRLLPLDTAAGSESRGMGRSPRPTPPLSPDVLPNGPPPPSPLVPVYLSSPPLGLMATEVQGVALVTRDGGTAAAAGSSSSTAREQSEAAAGGEQPPPPPLPPSGLPEATAGAEDGSSEAGGDASKGRSLSATVSESGLSGESDEGSGSGRGRGGGGDGVRARKKKVFFVPSGVCLLSTRPETGAMRRALAAYWAKNGDEILAAGAAVTEEGGGEEEGAALDVQESAVGRGGGDGKEEAAAEEASSGSQEADEEGGDEQSVGAWAGLTPDELRGTLVPFVTEERRREGQDLADVAAGAAGEGSSGPTSVVQSSEPATAGGWRAAAGWGDGTGSGLDFDPSVVLRCLSPRNLCLVVSALLCERKVVLVSSRLSLLTLAGEMFR